MINIYPRLTSTCADSNYMIGTMDQTPYLNPGCVHMWLPVMTEACVGCGIRLGVIRRSGIDNTRQ